MALRKRFPSASTSANVSKFPAQVSTHFFMLSRNAAMPADSRHNRDAELVDRDGMIERVQTRQADYLPTLTHTYCLEF